MDSVVCNWVTQIDVKQEQPPLEELQCLQKPPISSLERLGQHQLFVEASRIGCIPRCSLARIAQSQRDCDLGLQSISRLAPSSSLLAQKIMLMPSPVSVLAISPYLDSWPHSMIFELSLL